MKFKMKILAIDTSSEVCGVALLENENLIDDNSINDGRTHSEKLMPLIDEILKRNNLSLKDIELIAVVVGPGSFTGIRIGVASVKAMAEVNNIKIAEVTSLETLGKNIEDFYDTKAVLIDARNNQVYMGIFDNNINLKEEYLADDINVAIEKLSKYTNIAVCGNGAVLHKDLLTQKLPEIKFAKENLQIAKNTGLIGYKKYLEKKLVSVDQLMPTYLRKSQAERMKNL
jgi:tRNA threonylcarbamoyladenosine biosynthesis protein TsaB